MNITTTLTRCTQALLAKAVMEAMGIRKAVGATGAVGMNGMIGAGAAVKRPLQSIIFKK